MKHAEGCRAAALAFAVGHPTWGKRELASWLVGPYTSVVEPTSAVMTRPVTPPAPLSQATIHALLVDSYRQVLSVLKTVPRWRERDFGERMVESGLVVPTARGLRPASPPNMRLVDRVSSLFIADFLARPADYDGFFVCSSCDGLSFAGACDHARRRAA